ncbi:PadR family transcriptional regulator [Agrococcus sp. 1P02AA]|uniref:PadR family transcriptional regulator n=1 Tax=Agrococcus sp. 1P02AA TaxID=3132259 RepID=UPI0039A74D65
MTPVFGHGALRLYLLSLLAEAPRHGYELMQALEQRFGGTYSPSAGTIYPRLSKLEEEGLLTKAVDGRKTTYAITDAGRAELRAREGELHSLEAEITDSVRRLASDVRAGVQSAMQALRAELAAAERDARSSARRAASSASQPAAWPPSSPQPPSQAAPSPEQEPARQDRGADARPVPGDEAAPARAAAPEPAESPGASAVPRTEARMSVHDVDLALSDFRQQVREAVRRERGERMTPARAAAVRHELEAALQRITSVL